GLVPGDRVEVVIGVAEALTRARGDEERTDRALAREGLSDLAPVEDDVRAAVDAADGLAANAAVPTTSGRPLGQRLDLRRCGAGLGESAAGEYLPGFQRNAASFQVELNGGALSVNSHQTIVTPKLFELLGLTEAEGLSNRQVNWSTQSPV